MNDDSPSEIYKTVIKKLEMFFVAEQMLKLNRYSQNRNLTPDRIAELYGQAHGLDNANELVQNAKNEIIRLIGISH